MARLTLTTALVLLPATLLFGACDSQVEDPDDMEAGPVDYDANTEDPGDAEGEDADGEDADGDPEDDSTPGEDPTEPPPPDQPNPTPRPDAAEPCNWDDWGGYACTTEDGQEGTNYCILVDGDEFYTPCSTTAPECEPGEGFDQGCLGEICTWNGESFEWFFWEEPNCETPLVVNFGHDPIEFAPATAAASFDLSTDGTCTSTDWPTAPWLAMDRDGDGFIRSGAELFGSATKMSTGGYAQHGFAALAELDSNRDGKVDAKDERFGELVLWSDLDDDRIGAYSELRPVSETSLVSIDLGFDRRATCDRQGNCGLERTAFEYRTPQGRMAVGEVVDVHLACR